jgi:Membrane protein involved in the export of O-antigen and teichoic acid
MSRQKSLASGAVILGTAGLIAKVLGALYRIPLTNLIGGEGMGMYQLVYSLYAVMLSVAAGGFPVAVSRLVAERNADGRSSKNVLKSGAAAVVSFSLFIAAIMVVFSNFTARLQGNSSVAAGYVVIAPAVILVGAASLLRGWFQGNVNMYPTAISQLLEQAVKLGAGLGFAYYLSSKGIINAVCGALLGVTISELFSLIFLAVLYAFQQKNSYKLFPIYQKRKLFPS